MENTVIETITRLFEKKSGIVMSEKASNYAEMPKWKRVLEHLRPFGGTQVYSNGAEFSSLFDFVLPLRLCRDGCCSALFCYYAPV